MAQCVCPTCGSVVRLVYNGGPTQLIARHGKKIQLPSTDPKKRAQGVGGRWSFAVCPGTGLRVFVVKK